MKSDQEQREYYERTAATYDESHLYGDPEHNFSAAMLCGLFDYLSITSILDVGSGTGRVMSLFKAAKSSLRVVGVEPVRGLREVGYAKGFSASELMDGNATSLPFEDGSFDLVCAFAVMHHIKDQSKAIAEMVRVAKKAVFISDVNIYGQGSAMTRLIKRSIYSLGLWPTFFFLKTRGRNHISSEEDGISYSYSVFDSMDYLQRHCQSVHPLAIRNSGSNLLATASHTALLGIKEGPKLT